MEDSVIHLCKLQEVQTFHNLVNRMTQLQIEHNEDLENLQLAPLQRKIVKKNFELRLIVPESHLSREVHLTRVKSSKLHHQNKSPNKINEN